MGCAGLRFWSVKGYYTGYPKQSVGDSMKPTVHLLIEQPRLGRLKQSRNHTNERLCQE